MKTQKISSPTGLELIDKADFIKQLLYDYDLKDMDDSCLNNISEALLDATNYHKNYGDRYTPLRKFYAWFGFATLVMYGVLILIFIIRHFVLITN